MMTVINNKAIIAACTEFGARIGTQLDSREGDGFDIALKACLAALVSKPLTKKAVVGLSPSTLEKIASKRAQIEQLGGTVDESITKLGELNTIIKDLKTVKKAEDKAVNYAIKAEAKAKKEAAAAAKKAAATASKSPSFPKDKWRSSLFPNEKLGNAKTGPPEWAGKNGKRLRIAIHKENGSVKKKVGHNWTDHADEKFAEMFPDGKVIAKTKIKIKKIAKKKTQAVTLKDEQAALIAKLVEAPTGGESKNNTEKTEASPPVAPTVVAAVVAAAVVAAETSPPSIAPAAEEANANKELEEEEELEEIEIEEPDFPGENNVENFEHESLEQWDGVDFYKDDDENVWDENKDFVGTYDDDDETISFTEGYKPEE